LSLELYCRRGTNEAYRLESISIDGNAIARLSGINIKMRVEVGHARLLTDFEPIRMGEPGSQWVNTRTGALVEFGRVAHQGVHITGPKRGAMVDRVLDFGEWCQHYVPLDEWDP